MKVPYVILKTVSYLTLTAALCGYGGWVLADQEANESTASLRTELKAALAPSDCDANQAAQSVGDAIAAEIIASGLKTEILKQRLDSHPRASKVVALKTDADTASGQADQT
ncbi:MAG: hypothetical protein V3R81_15765 [Gammaproteobacteria bacterium]